ncbi:hypothetical protein [Paraburkholderia solisilvae]|uniref:Uncharacterized protein n=1 Tax=Paraburkholderia solisilvae TaxID=624376 RepID=A0A6J5EZT5_9BURK|nr:hypothetical protein [Paraburkholderia solisilvae]CAB3770536.1 hypothetical protein LMG29739_05812 [Paraburkholderia solisilvae]
MSRSRRKTPITSHGLSEATDKAAWHRGYRKREQQRLNVEHLEFIERSHREYSDPWGMLKDGKCAWNASLYGTRWMRK